LQKYCTAATVFYFAGVYPDASVYILMQSAGKPLRKIHFVE